MVNFSNGAAQGIMNEKEIPISLPYQNQTTILQNKIMKQS